jgi:hypothetical protein
MKNQGKYLWVVLAIIACSNVAVWAYPAPVGWYTFNEGKGSMIHDKSGLNHYGTINGTSFVSWVPRGPGNYALDFHPGADPNVGGYVEYNDIGEFPSWQSWQFSIEAWVQIRSIDYGNPATIMGLDGLTWNGGRLRHGLLGGQKFWGLNDTMSDNEAGQPMYAVSDFNVVMGTWYHVVESYDGHANGDVGEHRLYVNGALNVIAVGDNYRNNANRVPYNTGKNSDWVPAEPIHWLDGIVDEIKIWNVPLSADDVNTLYNQGPTRVATCADAIFFGWNPQEDMNQDCYVDFKDLAAMVSKWLVCNDPARPTECIVTW